MATQKELSEAKVRLFSPTEGEFADQVFFKLGGKTGRILGSKGSDLAARGFELNRSLPGAGPTRGNLDFSKFSKLVKGTIGHQRNLVEQKRQEDNAKALNAFIARHQGSTGTIAVPKELDPTGQQVIHNGQFMQRSALAEQQKQQAQVASGELQETTPGSGLFVPTGSKAAQNLQNPEQFAGVQQITDSKTGQLIQFPQAQPGTPQVAGAQAGAPQQVPAHTVQRGDTLSAIAARNGMSLQQLLALNPQFTQGGRNPDMIQVGETVNLGAPQATPAAGPASMQGPQGRVAGTQVGPGASAGTPLPGGGLSAGVPLSDFSFSLPDTFSSNVLTATPSREGINDKIGGFINEQNRLQEELLAGLQPTAVEQDLQTQLTDIRERARSTELSFQAGQDKIESQPIPMEFIVGQSRELAQQAERRLTGILNQEKNLLDRLGIEQSNRALTSDAAQTALSFLEQRFDQALAIEDRVMQAEDRALKRSQSLDDQARQRLGDIMGMLEGADPQKLTASDQAQLAQLAAQGGIPFDLLMNSLDASFGRQQLEDLKTKVSIENARRSASGGGGSGRVSPLTPKQLFDAEIKLSQNFLRATSEVSDAGRQLNQMERGLDLARQGNLNAGSQAVLVTFQKILDPTSVVRESEYARSGSGLSLLGQIEGKYEKIRKGGGGVTVDELEDFVKLGQQFYVGYQNTLLDQAQLVQNQANSIGADLNNIIPPSGLDILNNPGQIGQVAGTSISDDQLLADFENFQQASAPKEKESGFFSGVKRFLFGD